MKSKILFLLTVLCFAQKSLAADVIAPEKPRKVRVTSQMAREDKEASVMAQAGFTAGHVAQGLNFAYFIDRDLQLQAEIAGGVYTEGSWDIFNIGYRDRKRTEMRSYGVHLKSFVSNTFYLNYGLDWREYDYQYSNSGTEAAFGSQSLNASLLIGNQWQWKNFTLGCDWVGWSQPVAFQKITSENLQTNSFYERRDLDRAEDNSLWRGQLQGLRLYVGASF